MPEIKQLTFSEGTTVTAPTDLTLDIARPPEGSIIAYMPGYFVDGSNGTFTGVSLTLPDNWKVCDGSAINEPLSTIFDGANRYLPNLSDDRFLMGDTVAGTIAGSNTMVDHTHTHSLALAHTHSIAHDHPSTTSGNQNASHSHAFDFAGGTISGGPTTYLVPAGGGAGPANSTNQSASHTHFVDLPNFTGTSGAASTTAVTGAVGTGSVATSTENRPKYLACQYLMMIY